MNPEEVTIKLPFYNVKKRRNYLLPKIKALEVLVKTRKELENMLERVEGQIATIAEE